MNLRVVKDRMQIDKNLGLVFVYMIIALFSMGLTWADPIVVEGKVGDAFHFDGEDDILDTGFRFPGFSEMTASLWVYYPTGGGGGITGKYHRPLAIGTGGISLKNTTQSNICSQSLTILPDEWHHIIFSYNGTDCITLFDGDSSYTDAVDNQMINNDQMRIGMSNAAWDDYWNGSIDQFHIWNRSLSIDEMNHLHKQENLSYDVVANNETYLDDLIFDMRFDGHESPRFVKGQVGKALRFDGERYPGADSLLIPSDGAYLIGEGKNISISAWILPIDLDDVVIAANDPIGSTLGWILRIEAGRLIFVYNSTEGKQRYKTADDHLSPGLGLHHITFTYQFGEPSTADFYIDGVPVNGTWVQGDGDPAPVVTDGPLEIGVHEDYKDPYKGMIDDFAIYNRSLSPVDVTGIHNRGANGQSNNVTNGMVGYWDLDGSLNDKSNLSNDASSRGYSDWNRSISLQGIAWDYGKFAHDTRMTGNDQFFLYDTHMSYLSNESIQVAGELTGSSQATNVEVTIYDKEGNLVEEDNTTTSGDPNTFNIIFSSLEPGTYTLAIKAIGDYEEKGIFVFDSKGTYLPIIPESSGFGMDTTGGSGRHRLESVLDGEWDSNLAGFWDFDDGTADDPTYSGVTGILVDNASLVERNSGYALSLNGMGDLLNISKGGGYMSKNHSFTVSAWVKTDTSGGYIIEDSSAGSAWFLAYRWGGWSFYVNNGSSDVQATWDNGGRESVWRHFVGVYNASNGRIAIYRNGKLIHTGWGSSVSGIGAVGSTDLFVGRGFKGMIDDVMLFNESLSEKNILDIYANQSHQYFSELTDIYRVTTLNDSGPGSLRYGLRTQERERTIIFEVSGTIDLDSGLTIGGNYLTIAGQTAPSPGITIKDWPVKIGRTTHDILIQHIRFRLGDYAILNEGANADGQDSLVVDAHYDIPKGWLVPYNIVIDHCSFSWAADENVESGGNDVTFSNNIFSEGLCSPLHSKGCHSKGLLNGRSSNGGKAGAERVLIDKNLFAFNINRNPVLQSGSKGVVSNNLEYTYTGGVKIADSPGIHSEGVIVGNNFSGSSTGSTRPVYIWIHDYESTRIHISEDNYYYGKVQQHPWESADFHHSVPKYVNSQSPSLWPENHMPIDIHDVDTYVLNNSGARPIDRDAVDRRIISQVRNRTGGIIESQDDVGGWPDLAENERRFDEPENPSRILSSGYTALEGFIHNHSYIVEGKVNSTCGDRICTVLADENCSSCPKDCGLCPWQCVTEADNNPCDMIISDAEMDAFVDRWFRDEITITDLMEAMGHWK